jgi:Arc/MetJ-type ribon-helix-helix transcriptional regulator
MNHVFVSNSFSGLIISKQNNEFVSERLEHYDQDVEHMVKRGILISGDDFIRRGVSDIKKLIF